MADRICSIPCCGRAHYARGLCHRCYQRARANGMGVAERPSYEARFWAKVDKRGPVSDYRPDLGPCWLWIAGDSRGYGLATSPTGRFMRKAHRLAYEML